MPKGRVCLCAWLLEEGCWSRWLSRWMYNWVWLWERAYWFGWLWGSE